METEEYLTCCGSAFVFVFVKGVYTPYGSLVTIESVHIVILTSDRVGKTDEEMVEEILRVEANDAVAMGMLGSYYYHYHGGELGLQQDHNKAIELWTRAADLGCSKAHISLSDEYEYSDLGDMRKAKFHLEAAAMAGHEGARNDIGHLDLNFYSSIIRIELLSIGSLMHLQGHILPCITC